jgi:hypothetical protein
MPTDVEFIHGQLFVTNAESTPKALGTGEERVDGSTYMQGPTQIGDDGSFSTVDATLMVGPLKNKDSPTPDNSVYVRGNTTHEGDYIHKGDVEHEGDSIHTGCFVVNSPSGCSSQFNGDIDTTGYVHADKEVTSSTSMTAPNFYGNINIQSWKGFDIQHPTKENYRLRYVCLEGPEGGVYIRGRVKNKNEILLPDYWENLVNTQSITVSLTPIGAHQDVIVKRWDEKKVYLQARGGMPIDCFYHIFAERKDGEPLIVEYEGQSPADYPGDSSQYSIAGYDYGRRE